jgi:hypothetical protein
MTIEYDSSGLSFGAADDSGRRFRLLAPFSVTITHDGETHQIIVPAGFESDFASVPRPFWSWIPPHGRYLWASVVHDYLYAVGSRSGITRADADQVFYVMMIHAGVSKWRARIMYSAVRVGGGGRGNW